MTDTIDLGKYRSGKSRVFAGRARGAAVRAQTTVETLDTEEGDVQVVIPDDVLVVNTSFFLGLFGDSVRQLGASGFRDKYNFIGPIRDEIIADGIEQALREQSPLT